MAIGVVVVGIIAAVGIVFTLGNFGGDNIPIAVVAPTETLAYMPAATELSTPYPTPDVVPTYTPNPSVPTPTLTAVPSKAPAISPKLSGKLHVGQKELDPYFGSPKISGSPQIFLRPFGGIP